MNHLGKPLVRLAGRLMLLAALAVATAACVYRMNIQQGNYLDPKAIEQLQVGMTRSQVRYLLGTPMVPDAFDRDRWDYLYFLKSKRLGRPERRLLTVHFDSDKVARIDREGFPQSPVPSSSPETGTAEASKAGTPTPSS